YAGVCAVVGGGGRHRAGWRVMQTGVSLLEQDIADGDWSARAVGVEPPRAADLFAASAIIVPLRARGQCLGTLMVASARREHRWNATDVHFAEELGRRIAHCIDNSQLYADA